MGSKRHAFSRHGTAVIGPTTIEANDNVASVQGLRLVA